MRLKTGYVVYLKELRPGEDPVTDPSWEAAAPSHKSGIGRQRTADG